MQGLTPCDFPSKERQRNKDAQYKISDRIRYFRLKEKQFEKIKMSRVVFIRTTKSTSVMQTHLKCHF